ncbi:MAG: PadR family transcriptional regulator, partial [Haloferacaceae archaeon]
IHHGRLYPNLDTLVEKGLVEKGQRDRRTNYYTLTRRGRREIDARREWENQYVDL